MVGVLFVLPLFALANAGVAISVSSAFEPVTLAVIAGLVVGKPLGIFMFSWAAIAAGWARKPDDISWLVGAGMLAGIGFTMSHFIANLAVRRWRQSSSGILVMSLIAGATGMAASWALAGAKHE